jgi:hypothetical protein
MTSTRKTEDAAKALSKIALEPSRRQELWDAIEQRIDMDTEENGTAISPVTRKRNRSNWGPLGAAVAVLVLIATGITYGAHHENLVKTIKSMTGTTKTTSVPTPKPTIHLTLTLPNGQTVKPDRTVAWKNLSLSLIITSLPPDYAGSQIFGVIMGDGANRISQETVSTSIGAGQLWYTQRKDSTYAYYAIVNGNQNAYVLQAVVTGNASNAKSEVTSLLNSLHVSDNVGSDPSTGGSQYSNGTFGFTVNIPESWKDKYTISSISPQGGEALQSISFDYFKEKGQPFLLNLVVYPKDYLPHLTQDPQVLKAFSNDQYSFAFYKENEYPNPKDANYAEFKNLESEIPWVVSHFVVRQSNPSFDTRLTLPDEQVVKSDGRTVHWKDLTLSLSVTSLPPTNAGIDGYLSIVGNHATIISHQSVSTSAGSAMLIYFQRSQPAAAQSSAVTNQYYVIFLGSQYAYVLNAVPSGNSKTAKSEVIGLLPHWKLP